MALRDFVTLQVCKRVCVRMCVVVCMIVVLLSSCLCLVAFVFSTQLGLSSTTRVVHVHTTTIDDNLQSDNQSDNLGGLFQSCTTDANLRFGFKDQEDACLHEAVLSTSTRSKPLISLQNL